MLGRLARLPPLALALAGCGGSVIQTAPLHFGEASAVEIDGLTPCTDGSTEPARLDPNRPLVVLVHGCNDSAARFTALAEVFEAHDQQTVCFTYESRDRIDTGARRLARSLDELESKLPGQAITIIGHSQGGLVSRRAVTDSLEEAELSADYRLVTVSSPFAGIRMARHCALKWLYPLSFGITPAICHGVAGRNWTEIHRGARIVERPGSLRGQVASYLQIRTDERDACRVRAEDGSCVEDDFVFSLAEQENPMSVDPRSETLEVKAGHVEIVGDGASIPTALIEVLQSKGIMNATKPEQAESVARLLRELYLDDSPRVGPLQAAR